MATCDLMRLTNESTRRPFDMLFLDRRVLMISSDALLAHNISLSHNHNHPNFFFFFRFKSKDRQEAAFKFVVKRRLQSTTVIRYPTLTYWRFAHAFWRRNLEIYPSSCFPRKAIWSLVFGDVSPRVQLLLSIALRRSRDVLYISRFTIGVRLTAAVLHPSKTW